MALKYVAAYNLALVSGNEAPTAADITKILAAGDVEAVADEITAFLAVVQGKEAHELIAAGRKKLETVSFGGAAPVAAAAAAPVAAAAAPAPKEEEEAPIEFDLF